MKVFHDRPDPRVYVERLMAWTKKKESIASLKLQSLHKNEEDFSADDTGEGIGDLTFKVSAHNLKLHSNYKALHSSH